MKWWGLVTWLTALALAQAHTGAQGPSSCTLECMKVYTLHHKEFEQVTIAHKTASRIFVILSIMEIPDGSI